MSKLKNLILQLNQEEFFHLYNNLLDSSADKSALLLKFLYEEKHTDGKMIELLDVNTNAYYTLRSRLNQKVEEYLVQEVVSPRAELITKVASINEVLFTKSRIITIATLKKLEKDLLDYDLSNELTVVYKTLRSLHVGTEHHFFYSQQYNKHVAYMLSVDKAEYLLAEYFRKYGLYLFSSDPDDKMALDLIHREMKIVRKQYESHRLYVYYAAMNIYHRFFVDTTEDPEDEPIEDMLTKIQGYFDSYLMDNAYHHLRLVFSYLRFEYYTFYKINRQSDELYNVLTEEITHLLSNYTLYTYPSKILYTVIERSIRLKTQPTLASFNEEIFADFEIETESSHYVNYMVYRALCFYFAGKHVESAKWLNKLLKKQVSKKNQIMIVEVRLLLGMQYVITKEEDLLAQLISSVQRQSRSIQKEFAPYIVTLIKILKLVSNNFEEEDQPKLDGLFVRLSKCKKPLFCPTSYTDFEERIKTLKK